MKELLSIAAIKKSFVKNKVFFILILSLVGVQVITSFMQVINNREIALETLNDDLNTGERVVYEILKNRNLQLNQTAEILAKDYGFIEAFFSAKHDKETIQSVLENHLKRASAELMILTDLEHKVIAQLPENIVISSDANLHHLFKDLASNHALTLINFVEQHDSDQRLKLFHVVSSPLRAPNHVANLTVGYAVNRGFLKHIREMAHLELILASQVKGRWVVNASTLDAVDIKDIEGLLNPLTPHVREKGRVIKLNHQEFLIATSHIKALASEQIVLLIAKPVSPALKPFKKIEHIVLSMLGLSVLVSACAILMVTKRIVEPLSIQAHSDALTGVGNRRHFEIMVDKAILENQKNNTPFVVMILDLNKFKQINDQKGHDVGDFVLKVVAQRIQHVIRVYDCVFRFGGDEFAVLIEDCTRDTAIRVAEQIWQNINRQMRFNNDTFMMSASIGVAQYAKGDACSDVVKRADDAMYHAKVSQLHFVYRAK